MSDTSSNLDQIAEMALSLKVVWTFISPLIAGFVAAFVTHFFSLKRDLNAHKQRLDYEAEVAARQIRRAKLLEAYELWDQSMPERLMFLELPPDEQFERTRQSAKALGLVKLFGDEKLCGMIDDYVSCLKNETAFDMEAFTNELRDRVRSDYGLPKTTSRYKWVDFKKNIVRDKRPDEGSKK